MPVKRVWLFIAVVSFLTSACTPTSPGENPETGAFSVKVNSISGIALEGAAIEGGVDWESFSAKTDPLGKAILPAYASLQGAVIHLDNYFPVLVTLKRPYTYSLMPTPRRLRPLGGISGEAVRFETGLLTTVGYSGAYHLYAFDTAGVAEIATTQLSSKAIKQTRMVADTLWLATHDDGLYAYSLADPYNPQMIQHLDIPGNCAVFALNGNIVAVGDFGGQDSVRVFSFHDDGSFQELARFGDSYVVSLEFLGDYLVVGNNIDSHPTIYDLSNPTNPVLRYNDTEPDYWYGVLIGTQLVLNPRARNSDHKRIDLTNPASPQIAGVFPADSELICFPDATMAVGRYNLVGSAVTVLQGNFSIGYTTTAVVSGESIRLSNDFGGCAPPYFIIGNRLWILEDR